MGKKSYLQKQERKNRTSFLYSLVSRSVLFIFLFTLTVFAIYLSGNFQGFLDSTQRYLLKVCSIGCVLQVIMCVFGLVLSVIMFFVTFNPKYWIYFFIDLILIAFSVAGFMLMYVIAFLSSGI